MDIAIFTESYEPIMGAKRRQVLITPHGDNVRIYSRNTDGTKGPHNKWEEIDLDSLVGQIGAAECLTRTPVGVYVTSADDRAMTDKGYSPVLGTKACQAHTKATVSTDPVLDVIYEIYGQVEQRDNALEDYVIDGRRQPGSVVPVVAAPTQTIAQPTAPRLNQAAEDKFEIKLPAAPVYAALASVPRKELAEKYVHRQIWSRDDFEIFDYARSNSINVLIYGPTGPGKTTSVEAWAAERELKLATVSGNATMEPSQMFGKMTQIDGAWQWIDGPVTDVVRNGGVLLLDEVNFINPKIYTVLYSLMDGRRSITLLDHLGETIQAHKDLTVFATMNPDYIGTTPLNFAFRNRFDIQIPWDYDDKVENKLVDSKSLLALARQLRTEAAKGQYETPISTNMLMEFHQFVDALGYEFAVENFIAHFSADEAASVRLVFQTFEYNIKSDFGIEIPIVVEQQAESMSPEQKLMAWAGNNAPANV